MMNKHICIILFFFLSACYLPNEYDLSDKDKVQNTYTFKNLKVLPEPEKKVTVAVYDFPDLTGAFKANDAYASFSKAVPQGADTIVIDALLKAGNGKWFEVLERKGLNSLVQERKIEEVNKQVMAESRENHQQVISTITNKLGQNKNQSIVNSQSSSALDFDPNTRMGLQQHNSASFVAQTIESPLNRVLHAAEYIIEGGVVGYDTDMVTGGIGGRLLGIGSFGEVRKDVVTVNIRLVSVKTGMIILNKTVSKGIYSHKLQASHFGYIDIDKLLEAEIGYSYNEPVYEALNLTIQTAIYDIVLQGIDRGLWSIKNRRHVSKDHPKTTSHRLNRPVARKEISNNQPRLAVNNKKLLNNDNMSISELHYYTN